MLGVIFPRWDFILGAPQAYFGPQKLAKDGGRRRWPNRPNTQRKSDALENAHPLYGTFILSLGWMLFFLVGILFSARLWPILGPPTLAEVGDVGAGKIGQYPTQMTRGNIYPL